MGVAQGLVMILCGARAPMLIAVGMYLPFETYSAIFVAGMLKALADAVMRGAANLRGSTPSIRHVHRVRIDRRLIRIHGDLAGSGIPRGIAIVHAPAHQNKMRSRGWKK